VAGSMRKTIEDLREANAGLMAQLTSAQNLGQEWQDKALALQTERDSARHLHEVTVGLLDQAATDYRKDRDAAQAESDEWRDTARSEMAGRAAAEAEVERLTAAHAYSEASFKVAEAEVERLRAAIEWVLNTQSGVGKSGDRPQEGEREQALQALHDAALAPGVKP